MGFLPLAALLAMALNPGGGQAEPVRSAYWPGLWGPNRDARVTDPLRVESGAQLKEVWRRPVGKGFSEVAMEGDRGYTMFTDGEFDHLTAFDLATGKEVWRTRMDATYRGHDGSLDGPISTPVTDSGRIFALNPEGKLFAFEAASGHVLWQRDLKAELGGVPPFWGFATTPLPFGKTVVVQAGGERSNNLVALDSATGKTVWAAQPSTKNGYSSPVLLTLAGVPQIVAATSDKVFAVRPEDGAILWTHEAIGEPRQSPVPLPGDRLFVTSWEESAVLKVTAGEGGFKVQEIWRKPVLKTTFSPTVFHQGFLYGMNGMFLTCLDPETGEMKWRERIFGASLILVGDYLALIGEQSGVFRLVEASPQGFHERLKASVFTPGARSLTGPMFVGGRFLLRNGEEMVMLELVNGNASKGEKQGGG